MSQFNPKPMESDGYLRLDRRALTRLVLRHLHTAADAAGAGDEPLRDSASTIVGYTEWQGRDQRTISIGWDWSLTGAGLQLVAGTARANLMLVDDRGADLGPRASTAALEDWLTTWNWQAEVHQALGLRGVH